MSLLEIWSLIKVMGFSLFLLLAPPQHGGVLLGGVWDGEKGGVWVDGWVGVLAPLPHACGVALPSVLVVSTQWEVCDTPPVWHHELSHWYQWGIMGPAFPFVYAPNPHPWEGEGPWPKKPPRPPYWPIWPMLKWEWR